MSAKSGHGMPGEADVVRTPLPRCTPRLAMLWLLRRRKRYRVRGRSMWPTLDDGQTVLLDPHAFRNRPPQRGEIVLVNPPNNPVDWVAVKRVADHSGAYVTLLGDNPDASTDSRAYGPVPVARLLGRVDCLFP